MKISRRFFRTVRAGVFVSIHVMVAALYLAAAEFVALWLAFALGAMHGLTNVFMIEAAEDRADRIGPCGKCGRVESYAKIGSPIDAGWSVEHLGDGHVYFCPACVATRRAAGLGGPS